MNNQYFFSLLKSAEVHSVAIEIMCNDIDKNQDTIERYIPKLRKILTEINKGIDQIVFLDKDTYDISRDVLFEIQERFDCIKKIIREKKLFPDDVIIKFLINCDECLKKLDDRFPINPIFT